MQSNSGCFAIIVNTITTKKRGKIVKRLGCFSSPHLLSTNTFKRRVEILLQVLISQSLFASLCFVIQQMIYIGRTLTDSAVHPTGDRNHSGTLP